MDNERWGMFIEGMRCKVTMDPKTFQWGSVVPCSIGFKDSKTDTWTNVFIDILAGEKTQMPPNFVIEKGAAFKVWGRVQCKEWVKDDGTRVPQWSCWADTIEPLEHQQQRQPQQAMDDVLF